MPRDTDPSHLHPVFRAPLDELDSVLASAGIPLRRYEGARTPWRQAELFSAGRSTGNLGKTVTRAHPWESFHQYCMAVDEVFFVDGKWTWEEPEAGMWADYAKLAVVHGLRCLSFERPHVEYPIPLARLETGDFPDDGGDHGWRDWLETQAEQWGRTARRINDIVMPGAPSGLFTFDRPIIVA